MHTIPALSDIVGFEGDFAPARIDNQFVVRENIPLVGWFEFIVTAIIVWSERIGHLHNGFWIHIYIDVNSISATIGICSGYDKKC